MLPSPRGRRKDLLEQITGCSGKEMGLLKPHKRPRWCKNPRERSVQLPQSRSIIGEPEDPEQGHNSDGHLSNDDGDAYQAADDYHDQMIVCWKEGISDWRMSHTHENHSSETMTRNGRIREGICTLTVSIIS